MLHNQRAYLKIMINTQGYLWTSMYIADKYTNTHTPKCFHTQNHAHVQEKKKQCSKAEIDKLRPPKALILYLVGVGVWWVNSKMLQVLVSQNRTFDRKYIQFKAKQKICYKKTTLSGEKQVEVKRPGSQRNLTVMLYIRRGFLLPSERFEGNLHIKDFPMCALSVACLSISHLITILNFQRKLCL